ncbi:DUF3130 domain-containing protein [Listeria seeligeri]|uniref:DUF3130 domain-containing protein n=1 Tax=Listeria seeligeri TaxID=1640 RepID=UPI001628FD8C|nr:DUF3130 domain-containing protein [Listeria seeligeri]MBC1724510.1 DUF3130 family protein [Listeria seeligeri]MBF2437219.1 DUF3130 domain-containing protein [Listeria seeligeri]
MSEIKVLESDLKKYATKLGEKATAVEYLPMKGGNMAYSQANSINHFRTAMFDLVEAVDAFQGVVKTDAVRLKELGLSFTNKDRELERSLGLEVK